MRRRRQAVSFCVVGVLWLAAMGAGSIQTTELAAVDRQFQPANVQVPPVSVRFQPVSAQSQPASVEAGADPSQYRAVIARYCVSCHNEKQQTAGLALDSVDLLSVSDNGEVLEKVTRKLRLREMPPMGRSRPDPAVYHSFTAWLESSLDTAALSNPNPGRPALHRLNRTEYANAIRDLLGLKIYAPAFLPADDSTHGFDNIADVLGVSPELLESYVTAGGKISRVAFGNPAIAPVSETYRVAPDKTQDYHLEGLPFGTRGGLLVHHHFPLDGEYEFKVRLTRAGLGQVRGLLEPHDVELALDGKRLQLFTLEGGSHMYAERYYNAATPALAADEGLRLRLHVKAGTRIVYATFPAKSFALTEEMSPPSLRSFAGTDAGVPHVEGITITGPYAAERGEDMDFPARGILVCRPTSRDDELPCVTKILSTFARRAFRGPVTEAELQELLGFYEEGRQAGGFESGLERAVWRILAAPRFVFRFESEPENIAPGVPYRVTDLELASRLSFFLWSSIPDDQLLDLASRGQLSKPAVLDREVRRMLDDPRSQALVENFARQWLSLQKLQASNPDTARFRDFDDNLRQALRQETELLFEHIMREDRSVLELMTADYTFVNERLARHYGIPNVVGSRFRRVAVPDHRRGLLGHGSILTVSSFPTRTSPVLRGKWVLETILGSPPPPPPPDIPALNESERDDSGKVLTMREQMAKHRSNAVCANCHSRMDPLGLALESFDAVGAWRDEAFDASGTLSDGTKFDGPAGLREALMRRPEVFVNTMTEKLFTYALGRGLEYYDAPAVRSTLRDAARSEYAFSALILGVVKSVPFQMRSAAGGRSSTVPSTPVPLAAR